jgi:hypothetical protein
VLCFKNSTQSSDFVLAISSIKEEKPVSSSGIKLINKSAFGIENLLIDQNELFLNKIISFLQTFALFHFFFS